MQEYGLPLVFGVFILVPAAAKIMADGFDWLLSKVTFRRRDSEGREITNEIKVVKS